MPLLPLIAEALFFLGESPSSSKKKGKGSSSRSRAKSRKQQSEADQTETTGEKNEAENAQKDERPEESAEQGGVDASEETVAARSEAPDKPKECQIYFSGDDEDMNVDFNIDIDLDDDVRNEERKADEDDSEANLRGRNEMEDDTRETQKDESSEETTGPKSEEDERPEESANGDDDGEAEQDDWLDAVSGGSSSARTGEMFYSCRNPKVRTTFRSLCKSSRDDDVISHRFTEEKSSNFEAAKRSLKEIKVLIRKLNVVSEP